jgi:TolA-binding protein
MRYSQRTVKRFICSISFLLLAGQIFFAFADALPDEFVATTRWRDLFSRYSATVNPAFLTEENYLSARLCEGLILQSTFKLTELGVTLPVGLYQSWGLTYLGEFDPPVTSTGTNGETLGTISNSVHHLIVSYANNIWGRLSVGGNLSLAYNKNFDGNAITNVSADIGVSYRLLLHPVYGEHLIGLLYKNITSPASFSNQNFSNNLKASWAGYFWSRQIDAGVDFDLKNLYVALKDTSSALEYKVSARLGLWILRIVKTYFLFGSGYYGFAGGINAPHLNDGRDLSFMYQYTSMTETDNVSSHSFYFKGDFGLHREEAYAKRMARLLDIAPNELYNKALRLYYAGKYWEAFFIFSQIKIQFPSFFKNDWVQYYRGACLEKLDMRELSTQNYRDTKQEFSKSSVVPYADLGLMRIAYRDDNHTAVAAQFSLLNSPDVPDSLKFHAYYIMAQSQMKQKNYQQAIQLFSVIPETHPEYPFAQHSLAVSHVLTYNMEDALNSLGNCIEAKVQTDAQREIVNRSYVFLGYMFYEQLALSKAVTALRMVPKSSYYYEDALLGLSWSALRARQWNDCISNGQAVQKLSNKIPLQCEGALLEAYAHLMQKDYNDALTVLTNASAKVQALKAPSPDSLEAGRVKYRVDRKTYEVLAFDVNKMSLELQSSTVLHQEDSLHLIQQDTKTKLDQFQVFSDEFYRQTFFHKNIDAVKGDIEYALAIVQKISQQTDKSATQEKMQEKQKELDSQIQKLKKEVEKLGGEPPAKK